ncbi:uncharacterized protein [Macrobrachium rosenbergii]|uniref:uncharacterized protein n=1 Tax=Macrobrachium rosenbergii TaxID=79674 RepID=UPI0034D4B659
MEGLDYLPEDMLFSFSDVTGVLFNKVLGALQESQAEEDQAEGRFIIPFFSGSGGCNDAFSGFGFLAFLLALLDLILELSNDGARRLRRNAADSPPASSPESIFLTNDLKTNPLMEEASAACYSMHRGFLNALAAADGECAKRFLCEGAHEAASQGRQGKMIASVASENAASWLLHENRTRYRDVAEGGFVAVKGRPCATSFSQCFSLPVTYRYPRVYGKHDHHRPRT